MIVSQHYIKKQCENIGAVGFKPSIFCIQTQIPQARKPQHWQSHHPQTDVWELTHVSPIGKYRENLILKKIQK